MSRERELREVGFTDEFLPDGGALQEAQVDRDDLLMDNVALLGRVSKNRRVYTDGALEDAARLYPGSRFFLDHPTEREMHERDGVRSVRDLAGKVVRAWVAGDVVRGAVQVLDVDPAKSLIFALAEQAPEIAGVSHKARGEVRVDEDGTQIVESLSRVDSLDLVTEPASVEGLHESIKRQDRRERVREILAPSGLDGLEGFIEWCAARPDGIQKAEEAVEEFEEIVARPASGTTRTRRRRFGPRLYERDPDELLEPERRSSNGNGRDFGSIADNLFT